MREKEFGKDEMEKPKLLGWISMGFLLFLFHASGFRSPIFGLDPHVIWKMKAIKKRAHFVNCYRTQKRKSVY
jgi:hypothetical protein